MGYLFGGPHDKDCGILGSILGSPYLPHENHLHVEPDEEPAPKNPLNN